MTYPLKLSALAALLIGAPLLAHANFTAGDAVGTTEAEIRAALTAQGAEVIEIEIEEGEIEVEYSLGGLMYEMALAADTGVVLELEQEDNDQDDDHD